MLRKMQNLISRHYRPIWEACDREAAFELCNYIRRHHDIDLPPYDAKKLEEGWQWRTIFAEDWDTAKEELLNFVFGWW